MIPRPIYKLFSIPLWLFFVTGIWWLWFQFAAAPQTYYAGPESWFLYERLMLPPLPALPKLPWSQSPGLPEPEHYTVLGYPCPQGICMATPQSMAEKYPARPYKQYVSGALLRAQLTEYIFGGGYLISFLVFMSLLSFPAMFGTAAILDFRRYRRLIQHGVQIAGRRPVRPQDFSGLWGRFYWWKKRNVVLAVQRPTDD